MKTHISCIKHCDPHFGVVAQLKGSNWCKPLHSEDFNETFMVVRQPCLLSSIRGDYEPSTMGKYHFACWCGRAQLNSSQYEEVGNNIRIPTSAPLLANMYGIHKTVVDDHRLRTQFLPNLLYNNATRLQRLMWAKATTEYPLVGVASSYIRSGANAYLVWYVGRVLVDGVWAGEGQATREWPLVKAWGCLRQDCDQR